MEHRIRRRLWLAVAALTLWSGAALEANPLDLKDLDATIFQRLKAKSSDNVDVTLDGSVLKMAAGFLSADGDGDTARIRKLVSGLKSVTVRSFEFKERGDYTEGDLQAIRDQVKTPEWSRIVDAHKHEGDNAEIYILPGKDKPQGLFIIAAAPRELTVVHIVGAIDLSDLGALEDLGVPDVSGNHGRKGEK